MWKFATIAALAAALTGMPAAAEDGTDDKLEARGAQLADFLERRFEIKAASVATNGEMTLVLQRGDSAASCIIDASGASKSCVALAGEAAEELVAAGEVELEVIAFFKSQNCVIAKTDAAQRAAELYFEGKKVPTRQVRAAVRALSDDGVIKEEEDVLRLVKGCS